MNRLTHILPVMSALMCLALSCKAQTDLEDYAVQFKTRFAFMQDVIFNTPSFETPAPSPSITTGTRVNEIDETIDRNIDMLKGKTGLSLYGQAYYRPISGSVSDTEDTYSRYNSRWQVGIEWNYFQSALYKNADRIRELRLQGENEQLEFARLSLDQTVRQYREDVRRRYDSMLMYVLQMHSDNLDLLSRTQMSLLHNGKLSSDELLKVIGEKAETDNRLTAIKADTSLSPQPSAPLASVVQIDTTLLLRHVAMCSHDIRRLELEQEILECRYRDANYLKTTSITPFISYSYYTRPEIRNAHNLDIGISFRLPLSTETRRQRNAIKAEINLKDQYRQQVIGRITADVRALLHDITIQNRNIRGEMERIDRLKEYISDRSVSYANVSGEYNYLDRLQEYNTLLASWERLLTFQYQRDCSLIELQNYILDKSITDFIK